MQDGPAPLKQFSIENFSAYLAASTFVALCFVVAHEWGYFGVIGPEFQSLFTTYDYISELVVWIGPAFAAIIIIVAIGFALFRSDNFEIKTIATSRWGRFIENWHYEILNLLIAIGALLFSDEARRSPVYVATSLFLVRLTFYILSHDKLARFKRTGIGLLASTVPAMMLTLYGVGSDTAYADLKDDKSAYEIKLKNQYAATEIKVVRLIDKGAIALDRSTKSITFYRHEDIAVFARKAPTWENKSLACRKLGLSCPKSDGAAATSH